MFTVAVLQQICRSVEYFLSADLVKGFCMLCLALKVPNGKHKAVENWLVY